ncbi:hypothetical protein QJS04_geneDACA022643 [Acorus gramineus]|uniref:AB hydrolase-1 domain-containing protein n=1 Tax=Acorus gramineus TaxID=55184 RepID=A0AAV9B1E4_ACOGR|nr:hypothetical protein QJS04_geneDACA022643 [Acorus gramineus]
MQIWTYRVSPFVASPRLKPPDWSSPFAAEEHSLLPNRAASWTPGEPVLRWSSDFRLRSASVSGAGAGYPEQLLGTEKKQRKSVAGVDQEELLDPKSLADPDSFFFEFNEVQIHHKVCQHTEEVIDIIQGPHQESKSPTKPARIGYPFILLHGFGASVFSWDRVMRPLAQLTHSRVLAFDRPAFGLTSRTSNSKSDAKPLNPYSMVFSVLATLSFIDSLAAHKAILIGHSAGCLVAVNTYFEAPERVAALILVAPAIAAPIISRSATKKNQLGMKTEIKDSDSAANTGKNPLIRVWKMVSYVYIYIAWAILRMLRGMTDMIVSLYKKASSAILRSAFAVMLLRMIMDKFGIMAVRNSWYDASKVTDYVIQGYTKPLRVKGWETALLEFTIAMLTESGSKPPLKDRLSQISCPVLIITGDNDPLVPSWNARRLSSAIPGSTLEVINNCGHLPHEERVEEFISAIERFLEKVFSGGPT